MDVTVIVATYGDETVWGPRAEEAVASVRRQSEPPADIVRYHEPDGLLHDARNRAADRARTEWLCFLDADDTLDSGYLAAMAEAAELRDADLLVPAVQYVYDGGKVHGPPQLIPRIPLDQGNHMVIGTLVRTAMFRLVGGFEPWDFYEDWALWARCHRQVGARIREVEQAVYVATMRVRSRNRGHSRDEKERMHWQIHRAVFGEAQ